MSDCPHADIRFCPLYLAAHDGAIGSMSCDDGRLDEGQCAVSRGLDYAAAVAGLAAVIPRDIAVLRFHEEAEATKAQRARNMRAAGLH